MINNFKTFSSYIEQIDFENERIEIFEEAKSELSIKKEKLLHGFATKAAVYQRKLLSEKIRLNSSLPRRFIPDLFLLAIISLISWHQKNSIQKFFSERIMTPISFVKSFVLVAAFIGLGVLRKYQRTEFIKSVEQKIGEIQKEEELYKATFRWRLSNEDVIYLKDFLTLIVDKYWQKIKEYIEDSDKCTKIFEKRRAVINQINLTYQAEENTHIPEQATQIKKLWDNFSWLNSELCNQLKLDQNRPFTHLWQQRVSALNNANFPIITSGYPITKN